MRLLVSAGEEVEKDQPLIVVEPSPETRLQLENAKTAQEASRRNLAQTEKRFQLKLALNQDLEQAKQAAADADSKLASLERRGIGDPATLKADLAGIVGSIDARIGQLIPAGGPLLAIVPQQKIEVRLGVEPEDAGHLKAGADIRIFAVNQENVEVNGQLRLVTSRVNPDTRLIDIFVSVPPDAPLLLDGYVRGEITAAETLAFVVPRSAVLPAGDGFELFTVKDGHAVKHEVSPGIETDTETATHRD